MNVNRLIIQVHRRLTGQSPVGADAESAESARLSRDIEQIWSLSENYQSDYEPDVEAAWSKLRARREATTPRLATTRTPSAPAVRIPLHRRTWFRAAAAAVVLLVGGWFAFEGAYAGDDNQVTLMASDTPTEQTLPDGTKVILNANSQLSYNSPFDRKIFLTGEGYFDVSRDEAHPFLIETADSEIRVLGTAFNLRAYPKEECVEVHVTEGKVQFDCKANNETMILTESMRATLGFSDMKMKKVTDQGNNALAWQRGNLTFRNTKFETALLDMERFYGVSIDLDNEELTDCHLNGRYEQDDWNTLVAALETTLSADITQTGNQIKISGGSCN